MVEQWLELGKIELLQIFHIECHQKRGRSNKELKLNGH